MSKVNMILFMFFEVGKICKEVYYKYLNYISSNDVNCMIIVVYILKVYIFFFFKCNLSVILSLC